MRPVVPPATVGCCYCLPTDTHFPPSREAIRVWRAPGQAEIELFRGTHVRRSVPRHFHEEYQLCLILDGSGDLYYRGARHHNPTWSLFVLHPGEVHANQATAAQGCSYRSLNAAPELLRRVAAEISGGDRGLPYFPSPVLVDESLLRRFLRLHRLLEGEATRLEADAALLATLALLVERHSQEPPAVRGSSRESVAAARARDYLEAHRAENVSLEELARVAGSSPYHLNRLFRRAYGLPPHAYQIQRRLADAGRLLRQGLPPAAVAARTGFADQSHLHRHFKSVLGLTPGAYRARGGKNVQDRRGGSP
jgi:AraC-like DNA-binding protein